MFDVSTLLPSIIEAAKSSPYIIYIKDAEDNFIYLNNAACLATQADIETLRNKNFVGGSKEKDLYEKLFANDVHILKTGKPKSEVYFVGKPSDPLGKESCYYFTKQPISTVDGKDYILGFGVEITNKLVEGATLTFFKNVLNSMTDSFILTDIEYPFKIRYANEAFLELTGYTNFNDIVGKTPTEVLGKFPQDEQARKEFNEKLKQHKICDVVFSNKNKEGKVFKSHLKVIPLYHSNTDTPDYLMGIQRDITDTYKRKLALTKKRAQLAAIFSNITSYLWLLSPEFRIVEMNRSAQIQGKYASNVYKLNVPFVEGRWWKANKDCKKKIADALNRTMETGVKQTITVDFLDAADRVRHVRLIINPNRDATGNVDYIVVEGSDITELEKQRRQYQSIAKSTVEDPSKVEAWTNTGLEGKELERVVRMESTMDIIVPEVKELSKVIKDPEGGLIVNVSDIKEDLGGLKEDVGKLTTTAEGLFNFLDVAQKVPSFLGNPIVKWFLVFILGAGAFNTLGSTINKVVDWSDSVPIEQIMPIEEQP